jgi:MFS family permease
MGLRRSTGALRHLNFRHYFGGQLISQLGTWMQITAQIWLVVDITHSGGKLGIASALQFLPSLLIGPWAGVIADKVDNRKLLFVTNSAAGAFATGLGFLSAAGSLSLGWLYVAAVSIGVSNAFDRAAGPAFVSSLVPPDELPSAIGLYSVTASAARMIGTAVAGVLIASVGATACFFANAGSYVFVLASLVLLQSSKIADRRKAGLPVRLRDAWEHVRQRPILIRTLTTTTVVGMFGMNFMILVPAMVKLSFHADARWFGIAEIFSGAGSTAAGFLVGSLRRPDASRVALAAAALGLATVVTGLAPMLVVFCILMFVVGLTAVGFMTVSMTVTQANAEASMRGRVSALQAVANSGTMPIGSLVAGATMSYLGVRTSMVAAGCTAIAAGTALLLIEQHSKAALWDVPAPPAVPVEIGPTIEPAVGISLPVKQ